MAKIACFVPRPEMMVQAQAIMKEADGSNVVDLTHGSNLDAIEWARKIAKDSVDIIIARGLQAMYIKSIVTIPVVEMRVTVQEIGLLLCKCKEITGKARASIGIVGYENQFYNMEHVEELFNVNLHWHLVSNADASPEHLRDRARKAVESGIDILLGGDVALEEAAAAGLPAIFLSTTGDSFREAMSIARQVAYALDLEKANTVELKALLDNSFGGMVKVDRSGAIIIVNHIAESLFGWRKEDVIGKPITSMIDAIDNDTMQDVLKSGKEIYSRYINVNRVSMVANLSPIKANGEIIGAIFSSQEVKLLEHMGTVARKELYSLGHVAKLGFDSIEEPSDAIRMTIETAKQYALSEAPVLISSEPGSGHDRFAQAIHNASSRKSGPFLHIHCVQSSADDQMTLLFGDGSERAGRAGRGMLGQAHGGTAFLDGIERLSPPCQHRLLLLIRDRVLLGGDQRPMTLDVRVIASSQASLMQLVEDGQFSLELYYTLNNLYLEIPPVRRRTQDILYWSEQYVKQFGVKYKRYISLTSGAKKELQSYLWKGNTTQIASFCERLVLTAPHRSIDESDVKKLYVQMYPPVISRHEEAGREEYQSPEAAMIATLLEKYKGNRSSVAHEMGISTTTLWRKIKKHGIMNKY